MPCKRVSKVLCHRDTRVPELWLCPFLPFDATTVKLRHSQRDLVVNVLVQNTHDNDGKRSERKVEEDNVRVIENVLAVKVGVYLIPEKGKHPDDVLSRR
jgi:hypothetical protein